MGGEEGRGQMGMMGGGGWGGQMGGGRMGWKIGAGWGGREEWRGKG